MGQSFRKTASFGKRIEYWIIGEMLREGLDVYVPLVDDDAIDAVMRRRDGAFATVQIKARSRDVVNRDAALFAAITHELRENYWFVFYSERMNTKWIMTSEEFLRESHQNKSGRNCGKRSIWFNGAKKDRATGQRSSTARGNSRNTSPRTSTGCGPTANALIPNPQSPIPTQSPIPNP